MASPPTHHSFVLRVDQFSFVTLNDPQRWAPNAGTPPELKEVFRFFPSHTRVEPSTWGTVGIVYASGSDLPTA